MALVQKGDYNLGCCGYIDISIIYIIHESRQIKSKTKTSQRVQARQGQKAKAKPKPKAPLALPLPLHWRH